MRESRRWVDAAATSFWLDQAGRPEPRARISADLDADLVVVGGGFTGLWTALRAKEREPGRSVVVLEQDRLASSASGRNGGFCAASLTHGDANGRERWPEEMPLLRQLGMDNLGAIIDSIKRYEIDCGLEATGQLDIATAPWQVRDLEDEAAALGSAGVEHRLLDAVELREEFASPLGLAALLDESGQVLVDPARLAWGLSQAIESLGGSLHEGVAVSRIERRGAGVDVICEGGRVRARKVVVATAAFPALVRRTAGRVVPVYDYVLMTEPLSLSQLESIGWPRRRGVADAGNQFHYLRLTADDRILFGGYEAVYRFGQRVDSRHDQDPAVFDQLEAHFDAMFPSLGSLGFSHRWGGAIDTSTRFCASSTLSHGGAVATVNGFTGLGVAASRFFANAAIDQLDGIRSDATSTSLLQSAPLPFPPEPIRFLGIEATRRAIARADSNDGRRGPWLRLLDALGLGFDS